MSGQQEFGRRGFFRALAGLAGLGAMTRLVMPGRRRQTPGGESRHTGTGSGYRETPHIRKYYDKARF